MHHREGQVLSVDAKTDPAHAVVEVEASFRCARCAAGKGCGAGLFAGDSKSRRVDALVTSQLELQVGDRVTLLGRDGTELISAEEWAEKIDSIWFNCDG